MPIMDNKLVFSDAQLITVTAASDYIINWGETNPNLGQGTPLVIRFIIETTFTGATSMVIALQHGATSTPATTLFSGDTLLEAVLLEGTYVPEIKIPDEHLQYMRLYYTVNGTHSTGAITAWISLDR